LLEVEEEGYLNDFMKGISTILLLFDISFDATMQGVYSQFFFVILVSQNCELNPQLKLCDVEVCYAYISLFSKFMLHFSYEERIKFDSIWEKISNVYNMKIDTFHDDYIL
jgi:hypothetical protein